MDREIRKVCPYCGKEIKSNESYTVCPQCGVVHHMQCWEKNSGCCTKGCAASGKYVKDISEIAKMQHHKKSEVIPKPSVQQNPHQPYRQPAYKNRDFDREQQIRRPVPVHPKPVEDECDEYGFTSKGRMSEKLKSIVQEKTYYYDLKMTRLNLSGGKVSWNGSAFFLPVLWMAYRKMYLYALISLIISIAITMIGWIPSTAGWVFQIIFGIAYHVCAGIFANYIYKYHIENVYQSGASMDADGQWEFYRKRGGTSRTAVVVACVIMWIVEVLLGIMGAAVFVSTFGDRFSGWMDILDDIMNSIE